MTEPTAPVMPPVTSDPLTLLRSRLLELHLHQGKPSAREIHRRAGKGISHTTVAKVLRCANNPAWGQLELVVEALDGDVEEFRRLWIAASSRRPAHPHLGDQAMGSGGNHVRSRTLINHSHEVSGATFLPDGRLLVAAQHTYKMIEEHWVPVEPTKGPVPVGVDEEKFTPVMLDLFGRDRHLIVLGDDRCGKTNLLILVARGLVSRYRADKLVFAVFDPRRELADVVGDEYIGAYCHNIDTAPQLAQALAEEVARRRRAVASSGSWQGPRIVVLVDDYDVLTALESHALAPLRPFLFQATDLWLHFVVTRRVAGAAEGMRDPTLLALRESGATGLVMSGDRSAGQLFPGVYAGESPPGRGVWIRRGEPAVTIRTALISPAD
ncbi:hypothetical protein AB0C15_04705 [Micromonospora sp. NPDC048835]|uniref:hypothetical protein n=1 Tax=Micromonospora sp. NPDC048835 TaxID=3155147 RepID=UPI003405B24C